MISIYSSAYNLGSNLFDWQSAIKRFSDFGDEVCIATNSNYDYTLLASHFNYDKKIKIINTDISFDDYAFDGKLKNAALKACTQDFCVLLDLDEYISVKDKDKWIKWAVILGNQPNFDSLLIPVVDLFNSEKEYKSLGQKWYMHKNLPNLQRGIVIFAKKDNGKIDHTRSDTCELIYDNGELCKSISIFYPDYPTISRLKLDKSIHVWHTGWLDKQKRLQSNSFWQKHWDNRAGYKVNNIIHTEEELNKIEYWPHGLPIE